MSYHGWVQNDGEGPWYCVVCGVLLSPEDEPCPGRPPPKPDHAAALEWARTVELMKPERDTFPRDPDYNAARCILDLHAQLKQARKDVQHTARCWHIQHKIEQGITSYVPCPECLEARTRWEKI